MQQTTIHRASEQHRAEVGYACVIRTMPQDHSLSFDCVGALTYILSKPNDWNINISDLMQRGGIGRDKARRILADLMKAGYIQQIKTRDEQGRFQYTYHAHESVDGSPLTENPYTGNPSTVNPTQHNIDIQKQENKNKKQISPSHYHPVGTTPIPPTPPSTDGDGMDQPIDNAGENDFQENQTPPQNQEPVRVSYTEPTPTDPPADFEQRQQLLTDAGVEGYNIKFLAEHYEIWQISNVIQDAKTRNLSNRAGYIVRELKTNANGTRDKQPEPERPSDPIEAAMQAITPDHKYLHHLRDLGAKYAAKTPIWMQEQPNDPAEHESDPSAVPDFLTDQAVA